MLAVSALYLLQKRHIEFAKRSFYVAAAFGFASICSVIVLGDESGYSIGHAQQTKIATLEAMWETEAPPASFNVIAGINEKEQKNDWAIHIPYAMGIIGTRSLDTPILGIHDLKAINKERIQNGMIAVDTLEKLRQDRTNSDLIKTFEATKADLGFGLLLKKYTQDVGNATPEMIQKATDDSIPKVAPMFWSFRIMVGLGFLMLVLFVLSLFYAIKGKVMDKPWLLKFAIIMLPAPWIAAEMGWFVAEYGRQPWTVYGVLPTHLSISNLPTSTVVWSLIGFIVFYSVLFLVEIYLMRKYVKIGPASLGTGRYGDKTPDAHNSYHKGDSHAL